MGAESGGGGVVMRVFLLQSLVSQGDNDPELDFFSFSPDDENWFFVFRRWRGGVGLAWVVRSCETPVSASGS